MKKSALLSISTALTCLLLTMSNAHASLVWVGYVGGSERHSHSIFNLAAVEGDTGYTAYFVGNKLRVVLRQDPNPNWSNCRSYGIAAKIGTNDNHFANWPVLTFNVGSSGHDGSICAAVFDIPAWQVSQMGNSRIKMVPFRWNGNSKDRTNKDFTIRLN